MMWSTQTKLIQNVNHNQITCRACVQIQLDTDGVYAIIDTKMLKPPHNLLFNLVDLDYERNTYIVTLDK